MINVMLILKVMKSYVGQGQQTSDRVEHLWKIFDDYRSKSKLKTLEACFVLITEEGILCQS